MSPTRDPIKPGQESVWDYPRPPRVGPVAERVRVSLNGVAIAESGRGLRVLETSHPPVVYLPPADVRMELLRPNARRTFCEFKGHAGYLDLSTGDGPTIENVAWFYAHPTPAFAALAGFVAFYPSKVECSMNDERVVAQPGDFYGGWITSNIVGPFKGARGTMGW